MKSVAILTVGSVRSGAAMPTDPESIRQIGHRLFPVAVGKRVFIIHSDTESGWGTLLFLMDAFRQLPKTDVVPNLGTDEQPASKEMLLSIIQENLRDCDMLIVAAHRFGAEELIYLENTLIEWVHSGIPLPDQALYLDLGQKMAMVV